MRVGPLLGDQAPMPTKDGGRRDEPASEHAAREVLAQPAEQRPVGPVQARLRVGPPQHCDLVTQHEQLDILRRRRPAEERQPTRESDQDQIEQA
jgi:hypothetical protein